MMSGYLNGQGTAGYTAGSGMMGNGHGNTPTPSSNGGWPTGTIIATIVLAALLIGGALALLGHRLRRRNHRATPATS